MRLISTKTHGILDYLVAVLLIALPEIFHLDMNSAEGQLPMALGIATIVYSMLTSYELSIAKIIPMRVHLMIDFGAGVLLAASPWLFGFADRIFMPHLILGIFEIIASVISKTQQEETQNNLI